MTSYNSLLELDGHFGKEMELFKTSNSDRGTHQ